jgi:hypothetical protein
LTGHRTGISIGWLRRQSSQMLFCGIIVHRQRSEYCYYRTWVLNPGESRRLGERGGEADQRQPGGRCARRLRAGSPDPGISTPGLTTTAAFATTDVRVSDISRTIPGGIGSSHGLSAHVCESGHRVANRVPQKSRRGERHPWQPHVLDQGGPDGHQRSCDQTGPLQAGGVNMRLPWSAISLRGGRCCGKDCVSILLAGFVSPRLRCWRTHGAKPGPERGIRLLISKFGARTHDRWRAERD